MVGNCEEARVAGDSWDFNWVPPKYLSEVLPLMVPCLGFLILSVEGCATYSNHFAVKG